jgi:hypothetical protein
MKLKESRDENPRGSKLRYRDLCEIMPHVKAYDNSERLLYDTT